MAGRLFLPRKKPLNRILSPHHIIGKKGTASVTGKDTPVLTFWSYTNNNKEEEGKPVAFMGRMIEMRDKP
jgi:hypothetical protein